MTRKGQALTIKCSNCGNSFLKPRKEWYYGPKTDPKRFRVQNYECHCGRSFHAWIRPNKVTIRFVDTGKRRPKKGSGTGGKK